MAAEKYSDPSAVLELACKEARGVLREVIGVGPEEVGQPLVLENTPLKWYWIEQCDALVFTRARKTGLLISRTHAQGFIIRRMQDKNGDYRWSGPCFLRAETTEVGLAVGRAYSATVLTCMTPKLRLELEKRRHRLFSGIEATITCGSHLLDRSDFVSAPVFSYGLAGANALRGVSADFSFGVGVLTVDDTRNAEAYGGPVSAVAVLSGRVGFPPEMAPLHADLDELLGRSARVDVTDAPREIAMTRRDNSVERRAQITQDGTAAFYNMRS